MKLNEIRDAIDSVDTELLKLFAFRFELCKSTRQHKKNLVDQTRESQIEVQWLETASVLKLNPDFASEILRTILTESKALQARNVPSCLIGGPHESKT